MQITPSGSANAYHAVCVRNQRRPESEKLEEINRGVAESGERHHPGAAAAWLKEFRQTRYPWGG